MASLLLFYYLSIFNPVTSTTYIDHVSAYFNTNFELLPNDEIYSLDNNTKFHMLNTGNFVLSSRADSSSTWIVQWYTGSYSDIITNWAPAFVIQVDENLVVYNPIDCNVCLDWHSDTASSPASTYHFVVHNGGYAYLLRIDYTFARFTTNPAISSYSAPTSATYNYILATSSMNFNGANAYCSQTYGTTLASIHNSAQTQEANFLCSNIHCWIGLEYRIHTDDWKWSDGTNFDYENWGDGEPNFADQHCVHLVNQQWADSPCTNSYQFLCNRFPSLHTNPSVSPTINATSTTSMVPTDNPTISPTLEPSFNPTDRPSLAPSLNPTIEPTSKPTNSPSPTPSFNPSQNPSQSPKAIPTYLPTPHSPTIHIMVSLPTNSPVPTENTTYSGVIILEDVDDSNAEIDKNSIFDIGTTILLLLCIIILCICICIVILCLIGLRMFRKSMEKSADYDQNSLHNVNSNSNMNLNELNQNVADPLVIGPVSIEVKSEEMNIAGHGNTGNVDNPYGDYSSSSSSASDGILTGTTTGYNYQDRKHRDHNMRKCDYGNFKQWVDAQLNLPQYYDLFVMNGYDSIEILKEIQSMSDLEDIGIHDEKEKMLVLNRIINVQSTVSQQ